MDDDDIAEAVISSDELELAANVHYSFLPRHLTNSAVDISVLVKPFGRLGGDYCSFLPIDENRLIVCICDAVGHGIAAALFAARINTFVLTRAVKNHKACQLIATLNEFLCSNMGTTGMYSSFFTVVFNFENHVLEYAGGAHPPAYHCSSGNQKSAFLRSETTLLGIEHPLPVNCPEKTRNFHAGDKLVLYTDGLTEARSPSNEQFGHARLAAFTKSHNHLGSNEFNSTLLDEVTRFSANRFSDDVLLMCIALK